MTTTFILFMVLLMILSVLLIIIIMAQNPKSGGLSGTFGGASSAQFGVQRTNDFMERATWGLAISIAVLILLSIVFTAKPSQVPVNAPVKTAPAKTTNAPATNAPVTTTTTAPVTTAPANAPVAPAK